MGHEAEGVWGLTCDPHNRDAVTRILELKSRSIDKGFILVGGNVNMFAPWMEQLPVANAAMMRASWPGAITWIVPNTQLPTWVRGEHNSIAIRVPAHVQLRQLSVAFGSPLISTSANPKGKPPARSLSELSSYFGDQLDAILTGSETTSLSGRASIIKDALTLSVLRH